MAHDYRSGDRDQLFLLPPSMWDWLEEDHLAFFVIDAIELVDTSSFDATHPAGPGAPAYDPRAMLGILIYAYATGVRSSRAIARACQSDLAYKVIAANLCPDHRTIARFRAENEAAIKGLFTEVLKLCWAAGLASLGQIAIDGTKIGSDAALDQNRDADWIRAEIEKILLEAGAADTDEDAAQQLFDVPLPEQLRSRSERLLRLRAALAEVEAQEQAARSEQEERNEKAEREARPGAGCEAQAEGPRRLSSCAVRSRRHEDALLGRAAASGPEDVGRRGERRLAEAEQATSAAPAQRFTANITDPESRVMKTQTGWVQGFNVQVVANAGQVVLAYATTQDHNDVAQLIPMEEATLDSAKAAGIDEEIGRCLADAGYWSEEGATAPGPDRLIATTKDWKQRRAARELGERSGPPPEDATALEAMEYRLRTSQGATAYATRSHTVEPVFGDTKENRGFRRFMRRGLAAADSEAGVIFAVHNLLKIYHHNPSVVFSPS